MEHNNRNLTFKQSEISEKLGMSSSTLQRYRNDIKMLSPYRISANSYKRKQKISVRENGHQRPQIISIDLQDFK